MRLQSEFSSVPSTTPCRSGYRIALLISCLALGAPPGRPAEDPKKIVRQALRNDTRNRELERSYAYTLREETRKLDSGNAVKSTESKTWDVIPLAGGPPFRRLIERDDRPLLPKEEQEQAAARKKQEDERRKRQELRERETPEQRQKRLDARERNRQRTQEQVDDIVNGFDLRLVGEDQIDGMPVWVIEASRTKVTSFTPRWRQRSPAR